MRALIAAVAMGAASVWGGVSPACAQAAERIVRGALTLENVPEAPAEVRERLRQYVNTRGAVFQDWLPDGAMLIATRFGDTVQIHRVSAPMGARTQLTFYEEPVQGAEARIGAPGAFFFSKDAGGNERYQGWLYDPASGRAQSFTEPDTRNENFTQTRDGRLIAWSLAPQNSGDYDIYIADPRDPATRRRVLEGEGAMGPIDFSADGARLLIGQYVSIAKSRRFVLDVASGALTELTPGIDAAYDGGEFTPDGQSVILMSDEGANFMGLVSLNLTTGQRIRLTEGLNWDVEDFDLSSDGRTLAYVVNEAGASRLHLMDVPSRRALRAPDLPAGVIINVGFDASGQRLGFSLNSATAPSDAYAYDLRARELTRWTQSEVGGLDPASFTAPQLISWRSFDGREITGFYYRPRNASADARLPLIINIHGGPESQFRPTFSSTIQYWVNELGVAVIAPNVRGSAGYGKEFLALDNGERREDSVRDIGALLDWAAARPDIDAAKMMVYGGSYGGYMVLASMTHYNDRLAGAVDIVGISNFVTFLENTSGYRQDLRRAEYGDERDPAMRAFLQRVSPLASAGRITKPLFIVHGANDPRVPVSEAEQLLAAVRANGGEAWLMLAANEGHGFARRENQEAQREAETMFFRRVLEIE
ncbi:MAG: prolyl oligopeptidase family serine peptidase [Hyphomonadaceae bacterium]